MQIKQHMQIKQVSSNEQLTLAELGREYWIACR